MINRYLIQENFDQIIRFTITCLIVFIVFWYWMIPPRHKFLGSTEADSNLIVDKNKVSLFTMETKEGNPYLIYISEKGMEITVFKDSTGQYPLFLTCGKQYLWARNTKELLERYNQQEIESILDCFYVVSGAYFENSRNKFIKSKEWK